MTYEELKIQLDLCDPEDVLKSAGRLWGDYWFVVCDEGDCHLFRDDGYGTEDDIRKIHTISIDMIDNDIRKIIIPDSVTRLGDMAFWSYIKLTSVVIPSSVTSIGAHTFVGCSSLTNVTIPDSMISIGRMAFFSCSNLTSMVIPNSVMSIELYAFLKCHNLKSFVFKGKTIDEVKAMKNYPFGINDKSIIKCI